MVRAAVRMLVIGVILLAALAFVVTQPRRLEGVLPEPAIAFLERLGGAGGSEISSVSSGQTPADYLVDGAGGLQARGPIAAGPGNDPLFIRDVISGHSTRVGQDVPVEITTIRPILGCRLTPPMTGSVVGHAVSADSGLVTALATYNDTHLATEVQAFVDAYRKDSSPVPTPRGAPAYEAYDVAVTETAAPVYLVLENRAGNRLWNIHLAPGARIERVVLLGGDQAGVANLDPVVPVEVLLQDGLTACGIQPAYPPTAADIVALDEAELADMVANAASYDTWFRDSFGVRASESRIGYDGGTVSVVGPIPDETRPKAVYAAISGSKIRTTRDTFFEISGQVAQGEDFASRVTAIATMFAFGDLKNLQQGADF